MANKFLEGIKGFFYKLFIGQKEIRLGCYGSPNAGKTTLANKISKEFIGKEVGKVSNIPHETREVVEIEHIEMSNNGKKLTINLVDTPGIATKIDFEDFIKHGIKKKQAKLRAKEATKGIIEAIKWLDKMDVVLVVIDSTLDPYNQVNLTILGNLEARKIPVIIVANKIDLKNANLKRVKEMFPQYEIVGISAKTGKNIEELYKTIFKVSK
ncbi:MAG: Era-like GTP-binding protein [Candidatus Nanoarchaeia archaeon]|nr:Era-like GTP-binding protein [Candidatus Nanoarchaeia archaeon]